MIYAEYFIEIPKVEFRSTFMIFVNQPPAILLSWMIMIIMVIVIVNKLLYLVNVI